MGHCAWHSTNERAEKPCKPDNVRALMSNAVSALWENGLQPMIQRYAIKGAVRRKQGLADRWAVQQGIVLKTVAE